MIFIFGRPLLAPIVAAFSCACVANAVDSPGVLDPDWQIEMIASEPELVTPTGCCFDDHGRLLVIECHTHFPADDYDGPKTDRIYLFDDRDGDGVLDRQRLFYEGGVATMNIANLGDGSIAVATRSEVVRIRDSDGDDVADQRVVLLTHKTNATYPHNGLGGLTFGSDGWLYVGQGENFGEPYELVGTDGSKQVGGGEGGNVFRCRPDGSLLERVATGFWNPFGIDVDSASRLWVVGNDPDAMPPNRLLHVVPGGDYGFQYRFGRAGTHPLQSWNGEFPGTMPMAAGVGEAACAIVNQGPYLWVTSWGDNRIERYKIEQREASFSSETETVVQGDANFRPVGMAVAKDGSIYVTDWVDRSYPVHGKGRLWRISRKEINPAQHASLPELTDAERKTMLLRESSEISAEQRLIALQSDDPFVRQASITGLIQTNQLASIDRAKLETSQQRVCVLSAWRWKELSAPQSLSGQQRRSWIGWGLQDESDDVVLAALRWATERSCKDQLPGIRELLQRDDLSGNVFSAVIASVAYLETGSASRKKRDPAIEKLLIEFARNPKRSARLRGLAVRRIPVESTAPSDEELGQWLAREPDRALALEVVHLWIARGSDTAMKQLAWIAADETFDEQTRADALAGLSQKAADHAALINKLSLPRQPAVLRTEANRIHKRFVQSGNESRPQPQEVEAWNTLVGSGGAVEAGRRVFFRRGCANCHMHSGRGASTGPNLTTLAGQMTRRRVLESILLPSKEIGPLYVPWLVQTTDGKILNGLKLDAAGVGRAVRFQGADGNIFEVPLDDIELQKATGQSIMPSGFAETMTLDELRDLIAFLSGS